jgi:F0F1-type ATP synthase beta subunit
METTKDTTKYEELKALLAKFQEEADEFYGKQNKAAGVRLRKGLQAIKAMAQEVRDDVSSKTKLIPKNPKKIKTLK